MKKLPLGTIEISLSAKLSERSGIKEGKAWAIREQEGYLHTGHDYPDRFRFSLGKDADGKALPAYSPGYYALDLTSLGVDREYGGLTLRGVRLHRLPESEQAEYAAKKAG